MNKITLLLIFLNISCSGFSQIDINSIQAQNLINSFKQGQELGKSMGQAIEQDKINSDTSVNGSMFRGCLDYINSIRGNLKCDNPNFIQMVGSDNTATGDHYTFFERFYYHTNDTQNLGILFYTKNYEFDPLGNVVIISNIQYNKNVLFGITHGFQFVSTERGYNYNVPFPILMAVASHYEKFKQWEKLAHDNQVLAFNKSFSGIPMPDSWEHIFDNDLWKYFNKNEYDNTGSTVAFYWTGKEAGMLFPAMSHSSIHSGSLGVESISSSKVEDYNYIYGEIFPLIPEIQKQFKLQNQSVQESKEKIDTLFK
jgi:hypothetical protein